MILFNNIIYCDLHNNSLLGMLAYCEILLALYGIFLVEISACEVQCGRGRVDCNLDGTENSAR